jgi:NADPH-dependent ferric siderophore reductase
VSNITVTHAPSGLVRTRVVRSERVTPNMMRVTLGGGDLDRFAFRGFDQWVRLAVPVGEDTRFDNLPERYGMAGYVKYLTLPKGSRPVIRNYTLRAHRPVPREVDIDFVVHGTDGVAAPWAVSAAPGADIAFIDQGCGFDPSPSASADWSLLVADETGLPAVAGILRDLPRTATGHAVVELFDARDRQQLDAPDGFVVHWVERDPSDAPGAAALPLVRDLAFPSGRVRAFAVGESALATGVRRHLVTEREVPKDDVTFCGYWKRARIH